jgi:Response regulator containing CheY-like receiver domain and AraC-type DNA-binding domain
MVIADYLKKRIKSRTSSLFLKIFLICTFISLFLVTIFGVYTYYYILKNLDKEIEKYEQKKLNETLGTCNMLFGEMQKITMNYATNAKIAQFSYMPRDTIAEKYKEVQYNQDTISNTIDSSNYIENMFIYYEKNNFVLDYSGIMDLSLYYDTAWHDNYNNMTGLSKILETRKVKKRNEYGGQYTNIITFITGIPYEIGKKEGAIVLNVDEKIVSDLLKNITASDDHSLAFLVNESGVILSSNKENYYYRNISSIINIPTGYMNMSDGYFKLSLNGTRMISYFETSSINNWKLFYFGSENEIFKKSTYIRNITFFIFIILLILMIATSLLLSFKVYNPIKKIITKIKAISTINNENINDISMIDGSLNLLLESNKNLENQLKQDEILIREIFTSQLITGKLFNKNDIKSKAEYFSINLEFDYFKVAVIQSESMLSYSFDVQKYEFNKISMINIVSKVFDSLDIDIICCQDSNDNILILIKLCSIKDANETNAIIEQILEDIKDNIEKHLSLSVSIGIGRMYSDLSDVGVSCKEAVEALHYKFIKGGQSVISFADISRSEKEKLYYPIENEQKLISLIKLCEYEKTIVCLNDMLDEIIKHNRNFEHIELCLSNITGIIQRCIYELNLDPKEVFEEDNDFNVSIEKFKNMQHFSEWVSAGFRKIIEYQIDQQRGTSKSFVCEVRDYIEKVHAQEISLVSVANHFKYNSSYFCKSFKDKVGVSFWEYVAKIRVEKSKKLLSETSDTIEQIAGIVGYNNRFSYIRAFKKYTSITPGEYRLKFNRTNRD